MDTSSHPLSGDCIYDSFTLLNSPIGPGATVIKLFSYSQMKKKNEQDPLQIFIDWFHV
jgi:hypothetical protein